jgi:hypothetical protein
VSPADRIDTTRFASHAAGGFTVRYPADWEQETATTEWIAAVFLSPTRDAVDGIRPNVNVVVEPLTSTMGVTAYFDAATTTARGLFADYEPVDRGRTTLGGIQARWIEYRATIDGNRVQQHQVITVRGSDGVVVTLTASPRGYDAARSDAGVVLDSFRFGP